MTKSVIGNLPYGRLQINMNEQSTSLSISNFMSGKCLEYNLSTLEFGQFQDFAITFEYVFFLFLYENKAKIISIRNASLFECINLDGWILKELPNVTVRVYEIERRLPKSWTPDIIKSEVRSDRSFFLVASLFKVYLIQNDFRQDKSTVQMIFDSKTLSIKAVTYHINQLILKTCAGNDFLLILTRNGHVYSMGTGSRGELGISPMEAHTDEPRPIQDLIDADIKVIDIACGGWHGLALTSELDVYAWGLNSDGQCGLDAQETKVLEIPYPINLSKAAQNIRAERKSTFVTLEDGTMVIYGRS